MVSAIIKQGELKASQSNIDIIVGEWSNQRYILFLITKDEMQDVTARGIVRKSFITYSKI